MSKIDKYEELAIASKEALEQIDSFEWFCATVCADIVAWGYAYDVNPAVIADAINDAIQHREGKEEYNA